MIPDTVRRRASAPPTPPRLLAVGVAAGVAAVAWSIAYEGFLADAWGRLATPFALVHLLGTAVLTTAGLFTWARRPSSRIGPMLVIAAFVSHVSALQFFPAERTFVTEWTLVDGANWLGGLPLVIYFHAALTFPSGRAGRTLERVLISCGYIIVIGFGWLIPTPLYRWVTWPGLLVMAVALGLGVARFVRASPAARRVVGPVPIIVLVFTFAALVYAAIGGLEGQSERTLRAAHMGQVLTSPLVGIAFMASLLRTRLAWAGVGDLVLGLQRRPGAEGLVDALRRALRDPTLEVAFWLPERRGYMDARGQRLELAGLAADRLATPVEASDGGHLALIVHDRALADEQELIEAVVAAAHLALENARLQAALALQLEEVQASRVRIVAAADAERRRVERDLHDGAQQHLVGLAVLLQTARAQAPGGELSETLAAAADQLRVGLQELRELARGIHPAVLAQHGLAGAVESLAERAPVPVEIVEVPEQRFDPVVELTAYLVLSEALANIGKHAAASQARIAVRHRAGMLELEALDDGVGGAQPAAGSGLEGLRDRLSALGGELEVQDQPGGGTWLRAHLPARSDQAPTPEVEGDPSAGPPTSLSGRSPLR